MILNCEQDGKRKEKNRRKKMIGFEKDKEKRAEEFEDEDEFDFEEELFDKSQEEKEEKEIGIDLGTTNSVLSYMDKEGAVNFVKIAGDILIPSYLFFKDKETIYFGNKAKSYAKGMVQGTGIHLFKRRLRADSEKFVVKQKKEEKTEEKYYIFDTNVFLDQPDILEGMKKNEKVVLPITVEQELEYRKRESNTKYSAERALEQLLLWNERIIYEESDLSLLPEDFFKKFPEDFNNANNDNRILSIVMKYQKNGGILVSSDYQLVKLKCGFVNVKAMTLKEFQILRISEEKEEEFTLSGTEATTMFLQYLKTEAEKALKQSVTKAVITVPATFNLVEIENTKKAGLQAGFQAVHIEKEPVAAAIAYNIDTKEQATTFIYDFGGGTFDISVIRSDGKGKFEICATAGKADLGGENLTYEIERFVYDYLEENYGLSMFEEEEAELSKEHYQYNKKTIYWAAENCKIELSTSEFTTMTLLDLYLTDKEQKSVILDLSRVEFEEIIKPTMNQTILEMNNGLSKAEMFKEDIHHIILAGGTSFIPCVYKQVEHYFGRKPSADKNVATLIAEGAAIIANAKYGINHRIQMQPKIFDITYEDFGIALEKWNYSCMIPAKTALPALAKRSYSLIEDGQSQLNIKIFSRKSEAKQAKKIYEKGIEYLDELIMKDLPPMKRDEVDVVVQFEITKQYELKTEVWLVKKDGTFIEKGDLVIDRQSML